MKLIGNIKKRFYNWIDARLPANPEIQLRQRNIYILPTRYGWLMLAIILLILIAATNYQNNMGFMAGFVLLAIGALSIFYTYRNLRHLKIRVLKPQAVYAGDNVSLSLEVINSTEQFRASVGFGETKKKTSLIDIPNSDKAYYQESFPAHKRGWFVYPRMAVTSVFPFGIFQVWSWFKSPYKALIYPKPIAPSSPLDAGVNGEEDGSTSVKGSEDFYSVKEYQPGDPLKQVMWKAFARERGILTKEFEDKVGEQQLFSWQSVAHFEKELALSYLCHELIEANSKGIDFGLQMPSKKIDLGKGDKHLYQCLEVLALF